MTTKRFKFICDDENCFFKDGNKALYCYEVVDLLNSLSDENEQLKAQLKDCEKRVSDKEVEWLRNNTVWEQMPSNKRTFITTSTKEDYKMTEKRFTLFDDGETIIDNEVADDGGKQIYWTVEYVQRVKLVELLNELCEENKQLKTFLESMKEELSLADRDNTILEKENERLKHRLAISEKANFVTALEKENEQLKKEVEDLKQIYQKKKITYDPVDEAIYEW